MATPELRADRPMQGAAIMMAAVLAFAVEDAVMKVLLTRHAVPQLLALRSATVLVALAVVLAWRGGARAAVIPPRPLHVYGRGALIVAGMACYFTALQDMALADVVAIFFAAPLIQASLSWPLLGEAVGWRRHLATAIGFAGVLIMVAPAGRLYGWPAALALASAFFYAAAMVWSRALGTHAGPLQLTIAVNIIYVAVFGAATPLVWLPPTLADGGWIVVMAALMLAGHVGLAAAYALAPVSVVAPLDYLSLPAAVGLGVLIFGDWPTWGTLAGVPLVIASGIYVVHRARVGAT